MAKRSTAPSGRRPGPTPGESWYTEGVLSFNGVAHRHASKRRLGLVTFIAGLGLAAFIVLSSPQPASAEPGSEDIDTALVNKYVDATHVQQEAMKGVEMEMEVEAKLPRLAKQGKLQALRTISKLGKITYKALGFSGDSTVKQEVIARYLSAESEARDEGSIAITPANYKFRYSGRIVRDGRTVHMFELTPRKKIVGLFKGDLWIDGATGMPVREAGQFVKSPSVFLKKIAFVREYELQDGISIPKHIASTVDTRLVGRAELQIAFSHFTRQDLPSADVGGADADSADGGVAPPTPSASDPTPNGGSH
jgi:hypothetical protein